MFVLIKVELMRGTALSGTIWGPAKMGRDIGGGGGGGPRHPRKNYSDTLTQPTPGDEARDIQGSRYPG